jgi:hypothetical protein
MLQRELRVGWLAMKSQKDETLEEGEKDWTQREVRRKEEKERGWGGKDGVKVMDYDQRERELVLSVDPLLTLDTIPSQAM